MFLTIFQQRGVHAKTDTTCKAGQCGTILKTLADRIASNREEIYSHVITHLRTRLRFALLKSVLIAIRGVRGSVTKERTIGTISLNLTPQINSYDVWTIWFEAMFFPHFRIFHLILYNCCNWYIIVVDRLCSMTELGITSRLTEVLLVWVDKLGML